MSSGQRHLKVCLVVLPRKNERRNRGRNRWTPFTRRRLTSLVRRGSIRRKGITRVRRSTPSRNRNARLDRPVMPFQRSPFLVACHPRRR